MEKIKKLIFALLGLFVASLVRPKKKFDLCFVRLDAIGDYILFRNFVEFVKNSPEYSGKKILLIGNEAWRDLAINLDSSFVDDFIWVNRNKLYNDFIYTINKFKEIASIKSSMLVSSTHSRDFFYNDIISKVVKSNQKIACLGDNLNISKSLRYISNLFFNEIISLSDNEKFEFYKNKKFFSILCHRNILLKKPVIEFKSEMRSSFDLPKRFAVFHIGASNPKRRWGSKKFSELINRFIKQYNLPVVLCGGPGDIKQGVLIEKGCVESIHNLVGKTSLCQFLHILQKSEVLVSNETSAPHMAVALDVPKIFTISNGNHLHRFTPYPKSIFKNYYPIYHDGVLHADESLQEKFTIESPLNINEIGVKKVFAEINEHYCGSI